MRYAAIIALAPLLVLAACGSGDEVDPDEFRAEADAVCLETAAELADVRSELRIPKHPFQSAKVIERELPIREDGLSRLRALEAPEELNATWEPFLDLQEQRVAAQREGLDAARQDDEEAFARFQTRFEELSDQAGVAGQGLGLEACGEVLPPAGQKDVAAAVEQVLTSFNSTRVCKQVLTERMIQFLGFDDVEECILFRPAPTAKSLELLDIGGVASTYAFVDVEMTDLFGDVRQLRIELAFEDDDWKVDFRQQLSEPEPASPEQGSAESP